MSGRFLDAGAGFLEAAAARDLWVMLSSNTIPSDSWHAHEAFAEGEADFLTARNVEVYATLFEDLLEGLMARDAPLDRLWSLEIRNEYHYLTSDPPWSWSEGTFTAANGQAYDMARMGDRRRLSAEGLLHWADTMTGTIKAIVPDLLVSNGLLMPVDNIDPYGEGDPRWLIVDDFHERSAVDFFDIHGSRRSVGYARRLFNLPTTMHKPVVVGEFGGDWSTPDIVADVSGWWQALTCQAGFDGWLTWQWFEIDLGEPVSLGTFRLPIGIVTPEGPVDIRVLGRGPGTGGRFRELRRFRARIASGDVLEHTLRRPARGVRWVRFEIENMADTWVILHDVEIWRAR